MCARGEGRNLAAVCSLPHFFDCAELLDASFQSAKNEFWDYDRQVDIEAFSSKKLYEEISQQSYRVTTAINEQKNQVRLYIYHVHKQREW